MTSGTRHPRFYPQAAFLESLDCCLNPSTAASFKRVCKCPSEAMKILLIQPTTEMYVVFSVP